MHHMQRPAFIMNILQQTDYGELRTYTLQVTFLLHVKATSKHKDR